MVRYNIKIQGIVQGVGFRPFVYNLAHSLGLNGNVRNTGAAVLIDIEGDNETLEVFLHRLRHDAPSLSSIRFIDISTLPLRFYSDFTIQESTSDDMEQLFLSPDLAICPDCKRELQCMDDRRYQYPLINCTQCGPRFTITQRLPYDRVNTTMKAFPMCLACHREYTDPADRRYHAQPVACFNCGPSVKLINRDGRQIEEKDIFAHVRQALLRGKIIAVKGIGGYHLFCDAKNDEVVKTLRNRKHRDQKPLALMVKDQRVAEQYCWISEAERLIMESPKRPIVLLRKKDNIKLSDAIAPNNQYLGMMLPYAPMHLLLFHGEKDNIGERSIDVLVATSGNVSSEPIAYQDQEAVDGLKEIADLILLHNREILTHADDSVVRVFRGEAFPIRRSRGYVPLPVDCSEIASLWNPERSQSPTILACGGELKNTFCLNHGSNFYLSQHMGDLENLKTLQAFEKGITHFEEILGVTPQAIAFDLHPDYLSTNYALSHKVQVKIPIQHHHAHIASCMADNSLDEPIIGVALDGTGYGEDGHIWGGEFFTGDFSGFTRAGHLDYVMMPGGEAAIREPWRMALSHLFAADINMTKSEAFYGVKIDKSYFLNDIPSDRIWMVYALLQKAVHSPLTSSAGRLFDAVSALLGIQSTVYYEGQAAIELESLARQHGMEPYQYTIDSSIQPFTVRVKGIIAGIVKDIIQSKPIAEIAGRFHQTMACLVKEACDTMRCNTGLSKVILSGGVFQNMNLLTRTVHLLEINGFQVFIHHQVPPNDGGIALGQAVMAMRQLNHQYDE